MILIQWNRSSSVFLKTSFRKDYTSHACTQHATLQGFQGNPVRDRNLSFSPFSLVWHIHLVGRWQRVTAYDFWIFVFQDLCENNIILIWEAACLLLSISGFRGRKGWASRTNFLFPSALFSENWPKCPAVVGQMPLHMYEKIIILNFIHFAITVVFFLFCFGLV